jgi:hypothetical protein
MNDLLKKIKEDLIAAMTIEVQCRKEGKTEGVKFENAVAHKTVSRSIISMIPTLGKKPDETTVDDIYKLLKKYAGNEKERELYIQKHITEVDVIGISGPALKKLVASKIQELGNKLDTFNIIIAEGYLPKQATAEEVSKWISENIDFTTLTNKMQAMGSIMKQFKGADGNFIKGILMKL